MTGKKQIGCILGVLALLFSQQVSAQTVVREGEKDTLLARKPVVPSRETLQGLWVCGGYSRYVGGDGLARDTDYEWVFVPEDLYFDGDSVWVLQYPCQRMAVYAYSPEGYEVFKNKLTNGSERVYTRTEYDTAVVERLKRTDFIPECYTGKWELQRTESGGDGTGIEFIYPFDVQDILQLRPEQLTAPNLTDSIIMLHIGGAKRPFRYSFSREMQHILYLYPTDSWNPSDSRMWFRYWYSPEPSKQELKELRKTEGEPLVLKFRMTSKE